jgi:hypothetical protein
MLGYLLIPVHVSLARLGSLGMPLPGDAFAARSCRPLCAREYLMLLQKARSIPSASSAPLLLRERAFATVGGCPHQEGRV